MSGWWIEAEGRVWGPYPAERLERFKAEGRFGAASLVSAEAAGPFAPAALEPALAEVFAEAEHAADPATASPSVLRPLLAVADLRETPAASLEGALGAHGAWVRVQPGAWLVRARGGAPALRNALSRRLRPGEALLVVEAALEAAAWFNLDGETDRALRRLWASTPADAEPA